MDTVKIVSDIIVLSIQIILIIEFLEICKTCKEINAKQSELIYYLKNNQKDDSNEINNLKVELAEIKAKLSTKE